CGRCLLETCEVMAAEVIRLPPFCFERFIVSVFIYGALVWAPSGARAGGVTSLEDLPFPPLGLNRLRCWFFFYGHQFVPHLLRLPVEFPLHPFCSLAVPFGPDLGIVFDLVLHHGVEDDGDLVSRRGRCSRWT